MTGSDEGDGGGTEVEEVLGIEFEGLELDWDGRSLLAVCTGVGEEGAVEDWDELVCWSGVEEEEEVG